MYANGPPVNNVVGAGGGDGTYWNAAASATVSGSCVNLWPAGNQMATTSSFYRGVGGGGCFHSIEPGSAGHSVAVQLPQRPCYASNRGGRGHPHHRYLHYCQSERQLNDNATEHQNNHGHAATFPHSFQHHPTSYDVVAAQSSFVYGGSYVNSMLTTQFPGWLTARGGDGSCVMDPGTSFAEAHSGYRNHHNGMNPAVVDARNPTTLFPWMRTQEGRSRQTFTRNQTLELEKEFQFTQYLTRQRRKEVSTALSLTERQIMNWFQNRRRQQQNKKGASSKQNASDRITPSGSGALADVAST